MYTSWKALTIIALGAFAAACGGENGGDKETVEPAVETARDRVAPATSPTGMPAAAGHADVGDAGPMVSAAVAQLLPTEGHAVQGTVRFDLASAGLASAEMDGTGIEITGTLEGLSAGRHGFHVHEFGDCSAADGSSAGDHFNPEGQPHGGPDDAARHIGDLGNLESGKDGRVAVDLRDERIRLSGPHSIIGRGLVVHANADDLDSQPSGAAGARIACGVIGIAATSGLAPQQAAQPAGSETPERPEGADGG